MTSRLGDRHGALTASGWYRLTPGGWEPVDTPAAEAEISKGGGWDLVHLKVDGEEVTLW